MTPNLWDLLHNKLLAAHWMKRKTSLTPFASPLIMKLKLFIYLRNLCSGLMTKKLNVFGVNHA